MSSDMQSIRDGGIEKNILRLNYQVGGRDYSVEVDDQSLVIGRGNDAGIQIRHESVSRHHCKIVASSEGWEVIDLNSKNGIKHNTYHTEREWLHDGDRIDVGAARICVEIVERPQCNPANVVFEEQRGHRDQHTEIIDVDHMEVLFGSARDMEKAPNSHPEAHWPTHAPSDRQPTREAPKNDSGELLRLVSDAAETLLSCDSLDEILDRNPGNGIDD